MLMMRLRLVMATTMTVIAFASNFHGAADPAAIAATIATIAVATVAAAWVAVDHLLSAHSTASW